MDQHSHLRSAFTPTMFVIGALFVAMLLISNTVATKLVAFGPFVVAGGIVIFPLTYIFGDILTEVYGYRASRIIIWTGFFGLFLMSLVYFVVGKLSAPPFWGNQSAYEAILYSVPRISIASMIAYLVGEFCNSFVMSKMKVKMAGKKLWMRTIGSTIVGEGVDSFVFVIIAFAFVFPLSELVKIGLSGYILKVAYEVVVTPVTYMIVSWLKKKERIDVYDVGISYNPFSAHKQSEEIL